MVSQDSEQRREQYLLIMHDDGAKSREKIVESVRETRLELATLSLGRYEPQFSINPGQRARRALI